MKIKLIYENLKGEIKSTVTEMKCCMGHGTYFDYIITFKRCDDKIKEDFVIILYDNNKIIHKENVHIHWITNPSDNRWQYGITICDNGDIKRVISEVRYGDKKLPVCGYEKRKNKVFLDIQSFGIDGRPLYDKYGYPITHKEYCPCMGKSVREIHSEEFPKGVISKLKYNY